MSINGIKRGNDFGPDRENFGLEAKPILQLKFSPKHQTNSQRLYFPSTKDS